MSKPTVSEARIVFVGMLIVMGAQTIAWMAFAPWLIPDNMMGVVSWRVLVVAAIAAVVAGSVIAVIRPMAWWRAPVMAALAGCLAPLLMMLASGSLRPLLELTWFDAAIVAVILALFAGAAAAAAAIRGKAELGRLARWNAIPVAVFATAGASVLAMFCAAKIAHSFGTMLVIAAAVQLFVGGLAAQLVTPTRRLLVCGLAGPAWFMALALRGNVQASDILVGACLVMPLGVAGAWLGWRLRDRSSVALVSV
jgi:hypothetical protein